MSIGIFIFCLILIFSGAARIVMRMSFAQHEQNLLVPDKMLRVLPSYMLLLTSIALCIWLPDGLYQTIVNAITAVGGGFNG